MDVADIYRETRERMVALGRTLDDPSATAGCPATPEWRVKDIYAHQAGVAADILEGRLEGVATDPWTARQVGERQQLMLTEVLDEWDDSGPRLEEVLRGIGDAMDPRLIIDLWTHEQDVRQAVREPGGRECPASEYILEPLSKTFNDNVTAAKLPAVTVVFEEGQSVAGEGDSVGTLSVSRFEFMRAMLGRRSPSQMRAWDWSVEPERYISVLPVFGPRQSDLDEA